MVSMGGYLVDTFGVVGKLGEDGGGVGNGQVNVVDVDQEEQRTETASLRDTRGDWSPG